MLCGSETWRIDKNEQRRIEVFEMWCYRRMLKISWMVTEANEEILEKMPERRILLNSIKKRRNK